MVPYLTRGVVGVIDEVAQCGQQLRPAGQLSSHGNGGYQRPGRRPDEGGGVPNCLDGFLFDEALDLCRKAGIVHLCIVLENEASNGSSRLILRLHLYMHHITH